MDIHVDPEAVDLDRDMQEDSVEPEMCERWLRGPAFKVKIAADRRMEAKGTVPRSKVCWKVKRAQFCRQLRKREVKNLQGATKNLQSNKGKEKDPCPRR